MRLNTKGQVTIPAELRHRHGLSPGDEVEVIEEGGTLRIVRLDPVRTRGQHIVHGLHGRATTRMTTDELMSLLRDTAK